MRNNGKITLRDTALAQNGGTNMECAVKFSIQDCLNKSMERWLYQYKKNSVKSSTFNRLLVSFNTMCNYSIAYIKVEELSADVLQRYINKLLDDGYSSESIKKQFYLISSFIRFLMREDVEIRPVYLNITLPAESNIKQAKRDVEAHNEEEQRKLRKVCVDNSSIAACAIIILLETGMRVGELLALQWEDLLWSRRAIYIHRTLAYPFSRKKSYAQDGAKTKTSNRTIPLSTKALAVFRSMYEDSQNQEGFVFGSGKQSDKSIAYNPLMKKVKVLYQEAGVKWKGFHALRHTFATNCYYKGCDVKRLSKLLGHSNISITYNIYINLYGDCLEELREIVN